MCHLWLRDKKIACLILKDGIPYHAIITETIRLEHLGVKSQAAKVKNCIMQGNTAVKCQLRYLRKINVYDCGKYPFYSSFSLFSQGECEQGRWKLMIKLFPKDMTRWCHLTVQKRALLLKEMDFNFRWVFISLCPNEMITMLKHWLLHYRDCCLVLLEILLPSLTDLVFHRD